MGGLARPVRLTVASFALLLTALTVRRARAQACCAGASVVTPGRLSIHEDALVGVELRASNVFGSFSSGGRFRSLSSGSREWGFEQDLFGALRATSRAQFALLLPALETYRRTRVASEFGGGIGDINLSGRYDFVLAGESKYVPGIALLAGLTLPTGKPVESADRPLATDATGVGAFQGNLGIALEQRTGPWLFGLTGLAAKRASRRADGVSTRLATQWTALASFAYIFQNDVALAMLASYTAEGSAETNGQSTPGSSRRIPLFGVSGLYPINDSWRLQGSAVFTPPISSLGQNLPANASLAWILVRSWS
jgi:hypothetical protein